MRGKALPAFLIFSLLFLSIASIPRVSAQTDQTEKITFPIVMWPLDGNFKGVKYHPSGCVLRMKNRTLGYIVNSTEAVSVVGNVYINCRNSTNLSVVIKGKTIEKEGNYTTVTINTVIYSRIPFTPPEELRSTNLTIYYRPYNKIFALVKMVFSNLTVSPDIAWYEGSFDPSHYGWPRNITLSFLVNTYTGDSYLLDGGKKRYVGDFPLLMPQVNVSKYFMGLISRANSFVQSVKSNPWTIEEVVEKAKLAGSPLNSSRIINSAVFNFTDRIMNTKSLYLGLPVEFIPGGEPTVQAPFRNFKFEHPVLKVNISRVVGDGIKEAIVEYIRTGNPKTLEDTIANLFEVKSVYDPNIFTNHLIITKIPIMPGDIMVVPLTEEYSRELNASYLMFYVTQASGSYLHVKYDPRVFDPDSMNSSWKKYGPCIPLIQDKLSSAIANILENALSTGSINETQLENVSTLVENSVDSCLGINKTSESPTGPKTLKNTTSSTPASLTSQTKKGHSICGPALFALLPIVPLILRRLKR
ncbi:CGP-CTERM sorting domain-containing protein [Thermococcus sp.]|uniref:CGP-CTERM sorting domain-containing protein n=1 Tax=Thermococcus sp. TaxID=35749 RepID=UPI0025F4375E|nr:CGP-CTERM sorting domain-containing protein [Thermococcus sp.]